MTRSNYYTYVHRRLDSGAVFYVGKGTGRRAWLRAQRSRFWKNVVAKHGYSVEVVAEGLTEPEAHRQEMRLIKLYSRELLVNLTDGGEGHSGYRQTEEHRRKIGAALLGKPKPPRSPEHCAKISAAHVGKTKLNKRPPKVRHTPEQTSELKRLAHLGKPRGPHSAEHKRNISTAQKARWAKLKKDRHPSDTCDCV